jgi:hypothetical protein
MLRSRSILFYAHQNIRFGVKSLDTKDKYRTFKRLERIAPEENAGCPFQPWI